MLCYLNHVNDLSWFDRRKNVKSLFIYFFLLYFFFFYSGSTGWICHSK